MGGRRLPHSGILPGILLAHAHFKVLSKHVEPWPMSPEMSGSHAGVLRTGGVSKSEEARRHAGRVPEGGLPGVSLGGCCGPGGSALISYHETGALSSCRPGGLPARSVHTRKPARRISWIPASAGMTEDGACRGAKPLSFSAIPQDWGSRG